MALPYLDNPATLDPMTVMELDGLLAKLNSFLGQQHTNQGGHRDITATSVTVEGPVTVTGPVYATRGIFERGRAHAMGTWIGVPYAAGDFGAVGGAWVVDAGDLQVHRYALIGQTMHYQVGVHTSSVSGVTTELTLALPAGYTVAAFASGVSIVSSNAGAVYAAGLVYANPGDTVVRLGRMDPVDATWPPTTNATAVFLSFTLEVTG